MTRIVRQAQYLVFLVPILVVYSLFTIYPLLKAFFLSFTNFDGYSKVYDFVGLKNYMRIFADDALLSAISFTLFFTFAKALLVTVLAIPLAMILDRKFLTRNLHRAVFFFPSIPSGLLLAYIWGFILAPIGSGVMNTILREVFGIGPQPWLADPLLAKLSTVVVATWAITGWHAILYLAFLQSIPKEYYEAAAIDGASRLQQVRHITLPLLAPAMTISVMLLLTGGLKVFEIPFALTKGGPGYETYTITQVIVLRGITETQYGLASAMSIVFFLIVLSIAVFQVTIMQRREQHLQ
ncbi:MAG: sugar ABC transporter permease [Thermobacillus sp.]|jgi:raffinose/stachyose/melibiose transport system permease protein|uniref:Permease component of ABC-type sugar transporter n=2 Tax=Thermobacillus TaxID=76632 RepID=L0EH02_THECK|nr:MULTISPECIES: sugar ABC transporter permease [Thermobacillus]AGA58909.1 permease component of ABC-type sugar transporter [Thermobacillus composti KWC4]REK52392.1 MAG: sugar ABC transporter permease [Thermobacillus sp.]CAG5091610.1 ABC-type sugar transport systems, permease components [Thermobacillus xylanilyticus]